MVMTNITQDITSSSLYGSGSDITDPTDIAGLSLWMDGADASTMWTDAGSTQVASDGDLVYQWDDKSTNGYTWTQTTAGSRPTYKEDFNTSYSGLSFDGVSDRLLGNMAESASDFTVFAVCSSTATDGYVLDFAAGRLVLGYNAAAFGFYDGAWSSAAITTPFAASVISWVLDSDGATAATVGFDGSDILSDDYTQTALGGTQAIGAKYNGTTNPWGGYIAEIVIYNSVLSTADRQSVEEYLTAKWAL